MKTGAASSAAAELDGAAPGVAAVRCCATDRPSNPKLTSAELACTMVRRDMLAAFPAFERH